LRGREKVKSLTIICGIAVLLLLMEVSAFPVSYEFDFDDDGVWDTAWSLTQGETVEVKIWLDDYSEEILFGGQLYFQYDPSKILVNEAHSYPNDNDHGGPFDHSFSNIGKEENGVYELSLAHFDSVSVSNSKILLFSIELESIVAGADVAIKAANDLGFGTGTYDNGYVAYFVEDEQGGKEVVYVYPDDAVCELTIASSTTTSVEPTTSTTTSTTAPPRTTTTTTTDSSTITTTVRRTTTTSAILSSTTTMPPPAPTTTTSVKRGLCSALKIYGEDSGEIQLLRYIRDNILHENPIGRELIKIYYQWSPMIVKAMEKDEGFKEEVKEMIDGVLGLAGETE